VTQGDYIKTLKRFLTWMQENEYSSPDLNISKLNKIKSPGYRSLKTAEMILTPDEITRLIEATDNARDRCFVAILYESAAE
jgi:integrase